MERHTANKEMHAENLRRFLDTVRRKRLEKLARSSSILLHGNAFSRRLLMEKSTFVTALKHSPHSPNLSATDFFVFPRLKVL
jgi:hypothetical protein